MANINSLQIVINEFLQGLGEWLIAPMLAITVLGKEAFFVLLLPILYWCFDQMVGLRVGKMLLISHAVNTFFKFLFELSGRTGSVIVLKIISMRIHIGCPQGIHKLLPQFGVSHPD